jgi:hypothetical protein
VAVTELALSKIQELNHSLDMVSKCSNAEFDIAHGYFWFKLDGFFLHYDETHAPLDTFPRSQVITVHGSHVLYMTMSKYVFTRLA